MLWNTLLYLQIKLMDLWSVLITWPEIKNQRIHIQYKWYTCVVFQLDLEMFRTAASFLQISSGHSLIIKLIFIKFCRAIWEIPVYGQMTWDRCLAESLHFNKIIELCWLYYITVRWCWINFLVLLIFESHMSYIIVSTSKYCWFLLTKPPKAVLNKTSVSLHLFLLSQPSPLESGISNANTYKTNNKTVSQIRFHSKRPYILYYHKRNDNINMDSTITGSMRVRS